MQLVKTINLAPMYVLLSQNDSDLTLGLMPHGPAEPSISIWSWAASIWS